MIEVNSFYAVRPSKFCQRESIVNREVAGRGVKTTVFRRKDASRISLEIASQRP